MITHRARDDWETTPGDGEALARALRTIADDAPSPSADVPVRLDTVRSRVRRLGDDAGGRGGTRAPGA